MAADGLLKQVYAHTYVRWDIEPDPVCRALAAGHCMTERLRERTVLGRFTAAWIYGCAPAPRQLQLLVDHARRTTALPPFTAAVLHEVQLGPAEGMDIAGVTVTTPLRTAVDIARHGTGRPAVDAVLALGTDPVLRCPLGDVRSHLESQVRLPGKAAALQCVDAALQLAADAALGPGRARQPARPGAGTRWCGIRRRRRRFSAPR
ncbi:hypothetical protein OL239_08400 [Arthrobacter sp. ATA002]|uniref:type IV toxin-antitoxin system AbiEi family antitoxin n=1 Tax=Arthrobacter sp. ATA002 TaxID=2991715 RepID=UPI0022A71390|nr:type IV toxin-antitoxin system AbiEi family antitoxin [Arthrobacter sp. ATA002]WAP53084.1 hypothetical protein OL239_08400 [Arthrobacter sp. ATA002]